MFQFVAYFKLISDYHLRTITARKETLNKEVLNTT